MWYVPANLSCPGTQSQLTFPRPLPYLIRARTHDDVRRGLKQWNPFAPFRNASLAASTCGTTLTPLPRASETRFVGAPGPSLPGRVTATLYTSSGPPTRGGCSALAMGASVRASFFFFFSCGVCPELLVQDLMATGYDGFDLRGRGSWIESRSWCRLWV